MKWWSNGLKHQTSRRRLFLSCDFSWKLWLTLSWVLGSELASLPQSSKVSHQRRSSPAEGCQLDSPRGALMPRSRFAWDFFSTRPKPFPTRPHFCPIVARLQAKFPTSTMSPSSIPRLSGVSPRRTVRPSNTSFMFTMLVPVCGKKGYMIWYSSRGCMMLFENPSVKIIHTSQGIINMPASFPVSFSYYLLAIVFQWSHDRLMVWHNYLLLYATVRHQLLENISIKK